MLFFGLSQGITQKVWQDFSLCRQGAARKSRLMQKYLDENHDVVLDWFPKGSPQFNAVEEEEVWKQGKYDLSVSQYQPSLNNLKSRISKYYRTARFNLDIIKHMQRGDG